ncbi:MAG: DUF2569 family protein [Gammaproteobacteria bacterium]|nr:DUF2569 family protein [Gammaproteobacteria bacterium]
MSNWKQLSIDEAKAHPYYGVKGWLLLILILWALGGLNALFVVVAYGELQNLYGGMAPVFALTSVVFGLIGLAVAITGFTKSHLFPKYALILLYVNLVVGLVMGVVQGVSLGGGIAMILGMVLGTTLGTALMIWYFKKSKRVNVTYFHRERVGD